MPTLRRNNVKVLGESGPWLIYAHGFGCSQRMWDQVTPFFRSTHRQVLFDYVGAGKSDLRAFDASRYSSLHGYAEDVLDVCDALEFESGVTFIGHSVSSTVGLLASIKRPRLFSRLVLLGPSPCFLNDGDYCGGFERKDLEELLTLMDQNYLGWANALGPLVAGSTNPTVSRELSDAFCSTDPETTGVFARATFLSDNRADLPQVSVPSLILQHRNDALASLAVGEYVHSQLRGSTLQVLDVSGHCAHMSHPKLVADAIQSYLAQAVT